MYEFLHYRVRDVMTGTPVVIGAETPLAAAQALFESHGFNGLPVAEDGERLIGLLTKLDLLSAFAFTPESIVPAYEEIMRQPAARFMNTDPVTVEPEMPLTRVLQKMIDTRFKSFPVVEDGWLVGVIAREDIMRALRRAIAGEPPPGRAGSG